MSMDETAVRAAYETVRRDGEPINWVLLKYDSSKKIVVDSTGVEYQDFLDKLGEAERAYAYVRFETGDELSKRSKFALITWVGPKCGPLQKASVSTDKATVKRVINAYAKEVLADRMEELDYDMLLAQVRAAGGANYGTGKRD